jgi:hypothetical protein
MFLTGKVGYTMDSSWLEPKTQSTADIESAERGMQFKVKKSLKPLAH